MEKYIPSPAEHAARTAGHLDFVEAQHPNAGRVGDGSPNELPTGEQAAQALDAIENPPNHLEDGVKDTFKDLSGDEIDAAVKSLDQ